MRQWLAERGPRLAAVADPETFSWAGHWIAQLVDEDGGDRYVIMFGVPSGLIFDPLGRRPLDAPGRVQAWIPAHRRSSRRARNRRCRRPSRAGGWRRSSLPRRPASTDAPARAGARDRAGHGLEGDRYAAGEGTFSVAGGRGNDLTLIAGEVLEALELPDGRPLSGAEARRNIVTRGLDLNALVGRRFRIGELELIGRRRCEPCAHLQRLTRPGVLRELVHRGGLRADLITSGTLRVGDSITPVGRDGADQP